MLRMDEGILKILIFRKMADVEIQSFLFDQNLTHIFGYKNKIIVQKTILRPSRGQLYIKEVRKISNWSVKPFSSYSDHRLRKHGFEKNAFKVLSMICMQIETAPFKGIYLHKW